MRFDPGNPRNTTKDGTKDGTPLMSMWSYIGIVSLVILAASAGLALYYGIYLNPIGMYSSYVFYAMLVFLIILAIFGKKLEHHTVIVYNKKPKTKLTEKEVSTGAGTIQMASD